jgi:DNA-binding CsgD family transcriptional regulator
MRSYAAERGAYDVSRWNSIFSDQLEGSAETVPELKDGVFFPVENPARIPLTMSDSLTRSVWIPVRDRIMAEALAEEGRPVWGLLTEGAAGSVILCGRLVKSRADLLPLGVLILLIDPDRFARTVSGYSQEEGIEVTQKTDYSVLLDRHGTILSAADARFALKPLDKAIPGFRTQLEGKLPISSAGRYRSTAKIEGTAKSPASGTFWVVYNPIPGRDWLLVSVLPIALDALPFIAKILFLAAILAAAWFLIGSRPGAPESNPEEVRILTAIPPWFERLSPKEQTVLLFLLTGRSNKEIGFALEIREQTVKNYLHAIYQTIGVQDRFSALLLLQEAELTLEGLRDYARRNPGFSLDSRLFQ